MSKIRANFISSKNDNKAVEFTSGIVVGGAVTATVYNVGTGASISNPANNVLALGTNNTEKVRITSAGNVGINETNPGGLLQVGSSSASHVIITANTGIDINDGAINLYQATSNVNATPFIISTDVGGIETEKLRVTADGRTLIHTSTAAGYSDRWLSIGDVTDASSTFEIRSSPTNGYSNIVFTDATSADSNSYIGAIEYAHQNNTLAFKTNALARLSISSGGIVTIPNQPAFHASGNSNTLVDNTYTVIIGNTINVNVGNCYSSSNGKFTAPVNGVYHFSFWGLIYPHPSDVMNVTYYKNGAQWADLIQGGADSSSHTSRAGSVIMSMNANDYAELRINRGTGTEQAYGNQWNMCGFLIG